MNPQLRCERTGAARSKSGLGWGVCLAGILLLFGLGVTWLLSRSITAPGPTFAGKNTRRPAGQLHADARTLVAAVRYILEPEADRALSPAAPGPAAEAFRSHIPKRSFELSVTASNQTEIGAEPLIKPPARI